MDLELLEKIIEVDTFDLECDVVTRLYNFGYDYVLEESGMYIIGIPNKDIHGDFNKIALVSHLDTIQRSKLKLVWTPYTVRNKCGVLGADDRAGVFSLLTIIEQMIQENETSETKIPLPIVIFPNFEEVGGLGAKKICKDDALAEYIDGINLFIELDRKGSTEYVFYSEKLPTEIKKFFTDNGWFKERGSYSDVKDLTNQYKIPHVNLSIGYFNQHFSDEYLDLQVLERNIFRVKDMMKQEIPRIEMTDEMLYPPKVTYNYCYGDKWNKDFYGNSYNKNENKTTYLGKGNDKKTEPEKKLNDPFGTCDKAEDYNEQKKVVKKRFYYRTIELLIEDYEASKKALKTTTTETATAEVTKEN